MYKANTMIPNKTFTLVPKQKLNHFFIKTIKRRA